MKKCLVFTVFCIFLISCISQQEDKSLNDLKKIIKNEIEVNLINFDVRYAQNPAKGYRQHRIAIGIHENFKKVYSLISSGKPNNDSLRKNLQEGLEYYGMIELNADSLIKSRLETIYNALTYSKKTCQELEYLIYELENKLLSKTYQNIDKNSFKFTEIKAIVVPEKTDLKLGETYHAKIYITASDSTLGPIIKYKEFYLPLESDHGVLNIRATKVGHFQQSGSIEWRIEDKSKSIILPFEVIFNVK
jgi:hypothetical protein